MTYPLVAAADIVRWSYWVVIGGSGIIGVIMAYLLLPSRLQFLGRLRVRSPSRDKDPIPISPSADQIVSIASGTHGRVDERTRDPTREARDRPRVVRPGSAPMKPGAENTGDDEGGSS